MLDTKNSKITTIRVSLKRWKLFQEKIKNDKDMYFKITKRRARTSAPKILNAFIWLIINKKLTIDLTFGAITDIDSVVGITIDRDNFINAKKFIIDYEAVNFVPHPTGLSGFICRIVEEYLRMDWREVVSKYLEYEKEVFL
jgi:hypothetical protein